MTSTSSSTLKLLEPVTLSPMLKDLKNRFVLAAMTRARCDNEGAVPNDLMKEYYQQRSTAGFILTEGTHISPQAVGWVDVPGIYTEEQAEGWKKITSAVDTPMVCQLWHQGRQSHPSLVKTEGKEVLAPSAIAAAGDVHLRGGAKEPYPEPRAMTIEEVEAAVKEYGAAAKLAVEKAGFAGVEIHGANGYLIDTFIQSRTNKRTDKYGGSLEARLTMLKEVIDEVAANVPKEQVGIKLSPNGVYGDMGSEDFFETFDAAIKVVAESRLAFIELVDGLAFGQHEFVKDKPYSLERARGIIAEVQGDDVVTKLVGNCGYDRDTAEAALSAGHADMISFGRPYLCTPDLPQRYAENRKINEMQGPETLYIASMGAKGYTDYPVATDAPAADEATSEPPAEAAA